MKNNIVLLRKYSTNIIVIFDKEALDSNHEEKKNKFKTSATNAYEHSYLQHPSRYHGKH